MIFLLPNIKTFFSVIYEWINQRYNYKESISHQYEARTSHELLMRYENNQDLEMSTLSLSKQRYSF